MKLETFLNNAGTLLENNMAFYSKKADSCRKLRAKSTKRFFKGISRNQQGQAVLEFAVPSASNPGRRYQCYISVEPPQETLFVCMENRSCSSSSRSRGALSSTGA